MKEMTQLHRYEIRTNRGSTCFFIWVLNLLLSLRLMLIMYVVTVVPYNDQRFTNIYSDFCSLKKS